MIWEMVGWGLFVVIVIVVVIEIRSIGSSVPKRWGASLIRLAEITVGSGDVLFLHLRTPSISESALANFREKLQEVFIKNGIRVVVVQSEDPIEFTVLKKEKVNEIAPS